MDYKVLSQGPFWGILGGDLYELTKTETVQTNLRGYIAENKYVKLFPDGTLIIYKGYRWDGASGPTFRSRKSVRGSLYHDALYELIVAGLLPLRCYWKADIVLYRTLREDGMWWPRALVWMTTLHIVGKRHISQDRKQEMNKDENNKISESK